MKEYSHTMARCAHTAYLDGDEAKPIYAELGYPNHKFIDKDGAQVHIIWNDADVVLCFRGTEPSEFSDIKADLNAIPDRAQTQGFVHNGFQTEVDKIWDDIKSHMKEENHYDKNIFVCGHSLGGAMSQIASARICQEADVRALYTFGSPRVGTRKFIKTIKCNHYRYVNNNDIVPKVPFAIMGYKHHGELQYINFYGNIRKMSWFQRFKDGWRGRFAAWKKKVPFDGAYDHGMDYYVQYTEKVK